MRTINIANANKRDAEVCMEVVTKPNNLKKVLDNGAEPISIKVLKQSQALTFESLIKNYDDPVMLGEAIIDGDPEIDIEIIGKRLNATHKLYLRKNGQIAYRVNMQQVIMDTQGNEKERRELTKAMSNITGESVVNWAGKKFPKNEIIRKLVFSKKYLLRHVNGLTFDFLYAMAKELHDSNSLMLVGSGPKGIGPLVITQGGEPYRGYLEGRIDGNKYVLLLHLSNMEIKTAGG